MKQFALFVIIACSALATPYPNISIFGGGPFYHDTKNVVKAVSNSGFTTVVLWTLHVNKNGDLIFNNEPIIRDGAYVGRSDWPQEIQELKAEGNSVVHVEFSVGSWGVPDFETIKALVMRHGAGESSILYRNFGALKKTLPMLDAISFDDESSYDLPSSLVFSLMLGKIGYHISLTPYKYIEFWSALYTLGNRIWPGLVEAVYLQGYEGGAGADPSFWNRFFKGTNMQLGLWSQHGHQCTVGMTPAIMKEHIKKRAEHLDGAWVWLLDDVLKCNEHSLPDYANALAAALQ